jgi:potassium/hydrogen antiporter
MFWEIDPFFLIALLLFASLMASKLSGRFGIPALLMFLGVGMLFGSEGLGTIEFDDAKLANQIGTVALAFIIYIGGFCAPWKSIKPVVKHGAVLATVGVFLTALLVTLFVNFAFQTSLKEAMLIGAIISSTDASAVFTIFKSSSIELKGDLAPMLEFESGSNDPMAIFLTLATLELIMSPASSSVSFLLFKFLIQLLIGVVIGLGIGRLACIIFKRIRLDFEGLYPVLGISFVLLTFGTANMLYGNGFLAVYLCGLLMGNSEFRYKRTLERFYDGIAWLMQIMMFLILGLLVFPSQLPAVMLEGLAIAAFLMVIARPAAVYLCLIGSHYTPKSKIFLGWVGLRGAVPIILATYPLMAKFPNAVRIFDLVFFIVLSSVLLQGKSLNYVAKLLNLSRPAKPKSPPPIEFNPDTDVTARIRDIDLYENSPYEGVLISELQLPDDILILSIRRNNKFIMPRGKTRLKSLDTITIYGEPESLELVDL